MAEIYGRRDGLCGGYGGSMHLTDVARGFLGTSGIVAQGIPHATGAAYAAQIRGKGQVVLCFFGDGASKQGAFHESLNIASLWKLPIVYVMENNGYNVVTRAEQEDANAAAGEPLAVKAKAYSACRGVTVDGGDPLEVLRDRRARRSSARAPAAARRSSSRTSTGSARTATSSRRPACRSTSRSTRRSPCSATPRSTRRRSAATPCPRFRGAARQRTARSPAEEADAIAAQVREEMQAAVDFGLASPFPAAEDALDYVYA